MSKQILKENGELDLDHLNFEELSMFVKKTEQILTQIENKEIEEVDNFVDVVAPKILKELILRIFSCDDEGIQQKEKLRIC